MARSRRRFLAGPGHNRTRTRRCRGRRSGRPEINGDGETSTPAIPAHPGGGLSGRGLDGARLHGEPLRGRALHPHRAGVRGGRAPLPAHLLPGAARAGGARGRGGADAPRRILADARAWRSGSRPTGVDDRRRLERLSAAAAAQAESSRPGYRVLLVEDNSLVAAMYASALRRLAATEGVGGLAVDVAVDGNEAFARLHAQPPIDLIITGRLHAGDERLRAGGEGPRRAAPAPPPHHRHLVGGRRGAGAGEPAGRQLLPPEAGQVPGHRRHRPDPAAGRTPARVRPCPPVKPPRRRSTRTPVEFGQTPVDPTTRKGRD